MRQKRHAAPGRLLGILLAGLAAQPARAEYGMNLVRGATDLSHRVFDLHMISLWVCVAIGVVVFGAMFYSLFAFRKSRGAVAANFHENTTVEVVWTIIPFIILIAMAIPATKTLIALEDTSDSGLTIKVTGYQWRWQYEYLGEDVSFFSNLAQSSRDAMNGDPAGVEHYLLDVDNPVVVPVNTKVRFVITSNDVIHSWWVPALGWKQDAVPGFINDGWTSIPQPGVYRGQCAELCGKDHGFMPVVIEAKTQADYETWLTAKKAEVEAAKSGADRDWTMDELMERGKTVYGTYCVACHQANGQGIPPAFPALAGGVITTGPVEGHIDRVLHGKAGTAMQAFALQLNDVDLAAVITYERNAFGNDKGDLVQPKQIKALR
ncbi:cytochrome c oxidase subunit II [Immundisolibacter cernigliae]|uniref:Cytochrome c oxidase subunit 2 n=1 Tax=Immundisolibacter cernigliae TaxID=1810504 RepID=A0A1B1YR47_9GAMM|nr:cytochrome B559 subunit alpha [Immundisolibacter cernigliae]